MHKSWMLRLLAVVAAAAVATASGGRPRLRVAAPAKGGAAPLVFPQPIRPALAVFLLPPPCMARRRGARGGGRRSKSRASGRRPGEGEDARPPEVRWDGDGTYSWSPPSGGDRRRRRQAAGSSRDADVGDGVAENDSADGDDRLLRFEFDGCGTVTLRHRPELFAEPPPLDTTGACGGDGGGSPTEHVAIDNGGRTGVAVWSAARALAHYVDGKCAAAVTEGRTAGSTTGGDAGDGRNSSGRGRGRGIARGWSDDWTVLELGAGLGLPSAVCARWGMDVIATDGDVEVRSLLEGNLERNRRGAVVMEGTKECERHVQRRKSMQRIRVRRLDWIEAADEIDAEHSPARHPVFSDLEDCESENDDGGGQVGGADIILLSDVVYGATRPAWEALLALLNAFRDHRRARGTPPLVTAGGSGAGAGGEGWGRRQKNKHEEGSSPPCDEGRNCGVEGRDDPLVLLGYTHRTRDMAAGDERQFFALVHASGMEARRIPPDEVPHGEKFLLTSLFELWWVRAYTGAGTDGMKNE